jgi:hypothetical protein
MTDVLQPSEVKEPLSLDDPDETTDLFSDPDDANGDGKVFKTPIVRGRYKLPDPDTGKERAFSRASTIAKTIANTYMLDLWNERNIVLGMGRRPDLVTLAGTLTDDEKDKNALNDVASKAKDTAGAHAGAYHGTAVHNLVECADRGEDLPKGTSKDNVRTVQTYQEALQEYSAVVLPNMIERVVLCRELDIAGRLDRILKLDLEKVGRPLTEPAHVIGDLKTQKTMDFGALDIAMQLAIYSRADLMWNEDTGQWEEIQLNIRQDFGMVMHLPSTDTIGVLYLINLDQGWEYVKLAMDVREARKNKNLLRKVLEVDGNPWKRAIMRATSRDQLSGIWKEANSQGEWTKSLEALGMRKLAEIEADTDE